MEALLCPAYQRTALRIAVAERGMLPKAIHPPAKQKHHCHWRIAKGLTWESPREQETPWESPPVFNLTTRTHWTPRNPTNWSSSNSQLEQQKPRTHP